MARCLYAYERSRLRQTFPRARPMSDGHPIFAALYDRSFASAERGWLGERRSTLLSTAAGSVLEIGGGTGANLPHYRDAGNVVLTEPDPHMRRRLRRKLEESRVPVEVSAAGAEDLPFADGSFVQDGILPLWRRLCAGCHPNRDTLRSIQDAGFEVGRLDRFTAPGPFTGLVPFVRGEAVAP